MKPISFSKIYSYLNCGLKYYYTYNYLRPPQNPAMLCGSSIHKGIEFDMKYKIAHDVWSPYIVLKNEGLNYAKNTLEEKGIFIPDEKIGDKDKILNKLMQNIKTGLKIYSEIPREYLKPVSSEEEILIDTPFGVPFLGYLDFTDEDVTIWDMKTSEKKVKREISLQNVFYIYLYKQKWGVTPSFKYLNIKLSKNRDNSPQWWIDEIKNEKEIQYYFDILFKYVEIYLEGIEKKHYPPAIKCSKSQCYFRNICKYNFNK